MRLVTFTMPGAGAAPRLGAQLGDHVVDLPAAHAARTRVVSAAMTPAVHGGDGDGSGRPGGAAEDAFPTTLLDLLRAGAPTLAAARAALAFAAAPENLAALARLGLAAPDAAVTYLPPIPRPGKIVCLGRNYREHAAELGNEAPQYPVLFAKFANTLTGHRRPIVLPAASTQMDYEAELALVIGRTGKDIPRDAALGYVAGYTLFNDVTARDYQRRTPQWLQGKSFDGAGPIGPALVTADEVADPHALEITLRLNGRVMQHASTAELIFDLPTIIAYVSGIMTLEPGDVIATGTPAGVGAARDPQVWLAPGDEVEVEIGGVGTLRNPVAASGG